MVKLMGLEWPIVAIVRDQVLSWLISAGKSGNL
jgi:hypothetical protein